MSAQVSLHTASPHTDREAQRMARRLRVGFVGLGWIGRKRLDAVASTEVASTQIATTNIHVAALADSDPARLRAASLAHPDATPFTDIEAVLDQDLDAVVIATPNGLHAQQAMACLKRGIPVFCQKPLATTYADAERVIAAARDADRLLGIDFCYRHVSGMRELRQRLLAGALGEIIAIDLTFHNAYGPDKSWCHDRGLAGGGCLIDLGVHMLDMALWLQDMPPMERVRSRLFAHGEPLVSRTDMLEDLAYAEFIQANGAIVRLACSWHAHIGRPASIQMAIMGTQGGALWSNVDGSFYDFELDLFSGAASERLSTTPDDWGPRALRRWLKRLQVDNRFDPRASGILRSAALIEEVYRA